MGDVEALLLDLDGTLLDPAPGIRLGVDAACWAVGVPPVDEDQLRWLIGPPLQDGLPRALGLDAAAGEAAVAAFRRIYAAEGLERYVVYDGIRELLATLRARGLALVVATSKPEPFALRQLEHAALLASVDGVYGACFDGSVRHKAEVVAAALADRLPQRAVLLGGVDPVSWTGEGLRRPAAKGWCPSCLEPDLHIPSSSVARRSSSCVLAAL